jgi:hypothetical protein
MGNKYTWEINITIKIEMSLDNKENIYNTLIKECSQSS